MAKLLWLKMYLLSIFLVLCITQTQCAKDDSYHDAVDNAKHDVNDVIESPLAISGEIDHEEKTSNSTYGIYSASVVVVVVVAVAAVVVVVVVVVVVGFVVDVVVVVVGVVVVVVFVVNVVVVVVVAAVVIIFIPLNMFRSR